MRVNCWPGPGSPSQRWQVELMLLVPLLATTLFSPCPSFSSFWPACSWYGRSPKRYFSEICLHQKNHPSDAAHPPEDAHERGEWRSASRGNCKSDLEGCRGRSPTPIYINMCRSAPWLKKWNPLDRRKRIRRIFGCSANEVVETGDVHYD